MSRIALYIAFFLVALLAISFQSCFHNELEDTVLPEWKPSLAFPILTAAFTAGDILDRTGPEGYIQADDEGIIHVLYKHRVLTRNGADIFSIPDFSFDFLNVKDKVTVPLTWPNGDILKEILLTEGLLAYQLEWLDASDGFIEISIPQATRDGIPYSEIVATYAESALYTGTIDLSGYAIKFDHSTDNPLAIQLKVLADGLPEDELIDRFKGRLTNFIYDYIEGNLRSFQFQHRNDTIHLDLVENWVSGSIIFVNPRISFFLDSDLIFPLKISFSNFIASRNGFATSLSGDIVNSGWKSSPENNNAFVQDTATINTTNSNIADFLSISPRKLTYGITLEADINPDFSELFQLKHDSRITVDVELDIPLECAIRNAVLRDTFDIQIDRVEQVQELALRLFLDNSFPHDLSVQLYLADHNNNVTDSLLTEGSTIVQAGLIDENGVVTSATGKTTTIRLTEDKLETLYGASKIILRAGVLTANSGGMFVRYKTNNALKVKLGLATTLSP